MAKALREQCLAKTGSENQSSAAKEVEERAKRAKLILESEVTDYKKIVGKINAAVRTQDQINSKSHGLAEALKKICLADNLDTEKKSEMKRLARLKGKEDKIRQKAFEDGEKWAMLRLAWTDRLVYEYKIMLNRAGIPLKGFKPARIEVVVEDFGRWGAWEGRKKS